MARKGGTPENLIPAKKGEVRNPKGRPPVLPDLKNAIAKILSDEVGGINALEAALMQLRKQAASGNLKAIEMMLDRGYGRPTQATEASVTIESIVIKRPKRD